MEVLREHRHGGADAAGGVSVPIALVELPRLIGCPGHHLELLDPPDLHANLTAGAIPLWFRIGGGLSDFAHEIGVEKRHVRVPPVWLTADTDTYTDTDTDTEH